MAIWDWLSDRDIEDWRNLVLILTALVGAPLLIWRTVIAQKQITLADRALNMDRFQKGAAMLGDDRMSVRQAGLIYIDELARNQPATFAYSCHQVLEAFIRDRSSDLASSDGKREIYPDMQSAFSHLADLSSATGTKILLWETDLRGLSVTDTVFKKAMFGNCMLDFSIFYNVTFENCDFQGSSLVEISCTNVKFVRCNFTKARLGEIDGKGGEFIDCDLTLAETGNRKSLLRFEQDYPSFGALPDD